jgi:hypothetical protein
VIVAGWSEPADFARAIRPDPRFDETASAFVEREELLLLDALDHSEHAPGHVIVDRRHLPWLPDQGDDRLRPRGRRKLIVAC